MTDISQNVSCCSTPQIMGKIYIFPYLCTFCGLCAEVCPFGLPHQGSNKKYEISKPELCTECSACKRNCPEQAIIMQERKGCGCLWDVINRRKSKDKIEIINCDDSCSC